MLKINRIVTGNAFSYVNVEFMDYKNDQDYYDIKTYITDNDLQQIAIKTNDGKIKIISDWMVGIIEVRRMKPPLDSEKVSGLVISGEISYGISSLIHINDYRKYDIPVIFEHQLAFVSDGWLYICHQKSLIEITK